MKPILEIKNVYKKFRIQHESAPYLSLRSSLTNVFRKKTKSSTEDFWALEDISFDVYPGESIGIIGKNGAGKSTLLKILSKITPPSKGKIISRGRIASLLEVGTGFHPELTGRENVFLNGSILGMKRKEILNKFNEIVDFSGVEKFLDTPLKHYSSGMQLRLAFAVAAFLEPEILVIDEVLAVGDIEFQKKCLGKMEEISKNEGRTILFVSHNMASLRQLCTKGILLENGKIKKKDQIDIVATTYLNVDNSVERPSIDLSTYKQRRGTGIITFQKIVISQENGDACNKFAIGDNIKLTLFLKSIRKIRNFKIAVQLYESDGTAITNMIDCDSHFELEKIEGEEIVSLILQDIRFYPETYGIGLYVGSSDYSEIYDHIEKCISFEIINNGKLTSRPLTRSSGLLFLTPKWQLETTKH